MTKRNYLSVLVISILMMSCSENDKSNQADIPPISNTPSLFTLLSPEQTGITFSNKIEESLNLNVLMYEYLYNGGGVAVGDLNGDGLDDIYFSANVSGNQTDE